MKNEKVAIGTMVVPKVSAKQGQWGKVISIGANPVLPIGVVFEDNKTVWDFKEDEITVCEMENKDVIYCDEVE